MLFEIDSSWTLFLDRDGVVNVRLMDDYVKNTNEFQLLPGVAKSLAKVRPLFKRIVVVTNQQGIGKGLMTERNLFDIHSYCSELLEKDGAFIDAYYFAPELTSANSPLRKPNIGMGLQAKEQFPEIDFSKSIMVGDSNSDIEFGKNLGMNTVFIDHASGERHPKADATYPTLEHFLNELIQ